MPIAILQINNLALAELNKLKKHIGFTRTQVSQLKETREKIQVEIQMETNANL